ncbi:hypothetical protein NKH28_32005 [Mesorhizobium sp. M1227]|uniref:hypothetical protein n=1 Tax=Mesorhizobium sp. M1227 TaxID=2957071 RepID=UPI00333892AE
MAIEEVAKGSRALRIGTLAKVGPIDKEAKRAIRWGTNSRGTKDHQAHDANT